MTTCSACVFYSLHQQTVLSQHISHWRREAGKKVGPYRNTGTYLNLKGWFNIHDMML